MTSNTYYTRRIINSDKTNKDDNNLDSNLNNHNDETPKRRQSLYRALRNLHYGVALPGKINNGSTFSGTNSDGSSITETTSSYSFMMNKMQFRRQHHYHRDTKRGDTFTNRRPSSSFPPPPDVSFTSRTRQETTVLPSSFDDPKQHQSGLDDGDDGGYGYNDDFYHSNNNYDDYDDYNDDQDETHAHDDDDDDDDSNTDDDYYYHHENRNFRSVFTSPWWVRLEEWEDFSKAALCDDNLESANWNDDENYMDNNDDDEDYEEAWYRGDGDGDGGIPRTRRAHSAVVYTLEGDDDVLLSNSDEGSGGGDGIHDMVPVDKQGGGVSSAIPPSAEATSTTTTTVTTESEIATPPPPPQEEEEEEGRPSGNEGPTPPKEEGAKKGKGGGGGKRRKRRYLQQGDGKGTLPTSTPPLQEPPPPPPVDSLPPATTSGITSTTAADNNNNNNNMSSMVLPQEYMIVSGGFTDEDWSSFPVWAYDMTSGALHGGGTWINLSPSSSSDKNDGTGEESDWRKKLCEAAPLSGGKYHHDTNANFEGVNTTTGLNGGGDNEEHGDNDNDNAWKSLALPCPPKGRVGHITATYNGYLYVFGGLLYDRRNGVFQVEDGGPYVYRLRIKDKLKGVDSVKDCDDKNDDGREKMEDNGKLVEDGETSKDAEDDKGEDLDGVVVGGGGSSSSSNNNSSNNNNNGVGQGDETVKFVDDGSWQRIVPRINAPSILAPGDGISYTQLLNRGEVRGGLWKAESKLIMYGGLHVRDVASTMHHRIEQVDTVLGDVWSYDFRTDTWEMLAPSEPPVQVEEENVASGASPERDDLRSPDGYPRPRTAHAAAVVDDELIIYGGMGKVSPSSGWGVGDGIGDGEWEALDDVWIFDLRKREWRKREMFPALARAYHSLVGWGSDDKEGSVVAAFGGYRTVEQPVAADPVAFVFDDTLVSHPPSANSSLETSSWLKAAWPIESDESITHRLEHTAVLSDVSGAMYVWGGRFQSTEQIEGMWTLNVAGAQSQVTYHLAESDGLEEYEATVAALHLLVAALMFMSMVFTALCGIMSRQYAMAEEENGTAGNDAGGAAIPGVVGRRRGLRQDVIDSLPVKTYQGVQKAHLDERVGRVDGVPDESSMIDTRDVSSGVPSSYVSMDEEEAPDQSATTQCDTGLDLAEGDCCPICLVEYEEGDEIRTLPCKHEFHKVCVDPWLGNNASCPACRHSLRELSSGRQSGGFSLASAFLRSGSEQPRVDTVPTTELTSSSEREVAEEEDEFSTGRFSRRMSSIAGRRRVQRDRTTNALVPIRPPFLFARFLGMGDRAWFAGAPVQAGSRNANLQRIGGSESGNGEFHDESVTDDEFELAYVSSLELTEEVTSDDGAVESTNVTNTRASTNSETDERSLRRTRPMRLGRAFDNRRRRRRVGRRAARLASRAVPLTDDIQQSADTVLV